MLALPEIDAAKVPAMSQSPRVRCFKVHPRDNVATLLGDAEQEPVLVLGVGASGAVQLLEPIRLGHKVALETIESGSAIVKFGETIGRAKNQIDRGSWVHLHNVTSEFDARSQTLDVQTGAVTDTKYE